MKPCPFCGETLPNLHIVRYEQFKAVHCVCGCDGTPDLGESGAIEVWNTRPIEDALRARIADLEAANRELTIVLNDVMVWIDGWSPNFTDDPEWTETNAAVWKALEARHHE